MCDLCAGTIVSSRICTDVVGVVIRERFLQTVKSTLTARVACHTCMYGDILGHTLARPCV